MLFQRVTARGHDLLEAFAGDEDAGNVQAQFPARAEVSPTDVGTIGASALRVARRRLARTLTQLNETRSDAIGKGALHGSGYIGQVTKACKTGFEEASDWAAVQVAEILGDPFRCFRSEPTPRINRSQRRASHLVRSVRQK